jgi:hypothetical protein
MIVRLGLYVQVRTKAVATWPRNHRTTVKIAWSTTSPSGAKSQYFLAGEWRTPRALVQKHMTSLDDLLQLALGHPGQRDAVMVAEIDHRIPMCVGCNE